MAAQCARLAELAERPNVVVQVVPPVTIPLATASLMITRRRRLHRERAERQRLHRRGNSSVAGTDVR
jgi:hypothetical protein